MLQKSNLIPRQSGRKIGSYYIDYMGHYKINEIAKVMGVENSHIKNIYIENKGTYSEEFDVYYFSCIEDADKAIAQISSGISENKAGKLIFLTEREIEYIRKALINDGENIISINNKIKDSLFRKLNS